jgi:hypothetical protein
MNRLLAFLSQWLPWLLLPMTKRHFQDEERAEQSLARVAQNWVKPDRESLLVPGIRELMAASLVESLRQGINGLAYDGAVLGRPWGFRLEDVACSTICLWHGELDKEIPVTVGRDVAGRIAHCQATYYPMEGHISLIVNQQEAIVRSLMV